MREEHRQLTGEHQARAVELVVQRLDPEPVASHERPALTPVVQAQREHPVETMDQVGSVLLPEVHQHLGVGTSAEAMPAGLEVAAEFGEIVDLAVEDDLDAAVLVGDRLRPAGGIDHGEAPDPRGQPGGLEKSLGVGAAMDHRGEHRPDLAGIHRLHFQVEATADAAHLESLSV